MQNYDAIVQKKLKDKKAKEVSKAESDKLTTKDLKKLQKLQKETIEEFLKKSQLIEKLEKVLNWYLKQNHVDPSYKISKRWSSGKNLYAEDYPNHITFNFEVATERSFFKILFDRFSYLLNIVIKLDRNFLKDTTSDSIIIQNFSRDIFDLLYFKRSHNSSEVDELVKTVEDKLTNYIVFVKYFFENHEKSDFKKRIKKYGKPVKEKKLQEGYISKLGQSLISNDEQYEYQCDSGKKYSLITSRLIYFFGDPNHKFVPERGRGSNLKYLVPMPRTIHALVRPYRERKYVYLIKISLRYQNGNKKYWRDGQRLQSNPYENCNASIETLWSSDFESPYMYDLSKTNLTDYEIKKIKNEIKSTKSKKFKDKIIKINKRYWSLIKNISYASYSLLKNIPYASYSLLKNISYASYSLLKNISYASYHSFISYNYNSYKSIKNSHKGIKKYWSALKDKDWDYVKHRTILYILTWIISITIIVLLVIFGLWYDEYI